MAKKHAFGTTFTWNSVSIAGLTSINGVDITVDQADVTSHLSADSYDEMLPGIIRTGEIAIEGFLDTADTTGQHAMLTDMNAKTSRAWAIAGPSSAVTWSGTGYIVGFKVGDFPTNNGIPFSARIKNTGKPTFAISAVTGMSACGFSNDVLMMPTFDIATFTYVVTITNGHTSTVITPVDTSDGEIITITAPDGTTQTVATGVASSAIAIASDENNVIKITISHATKAPKTYTFNCAVLAG